MFVCLGFGHFILFVYFFLGREAQKVREWGVNSLKTSIFPLPTPLRGCRSLLEIVFLWDSVRCLCVLDLVILFYLFIFFLGREAQKVCEWGVNSLKTSIFPLPTPLRGCRSLLEIVFFFVGQCEVFVCLGFGHFILFVYFFPWPRSSKGPRMGRQFFKNVDFSVTYPLKGV